MTGRLSDKSVQQKVYIMKKTSKTVVSKNSGAKKIAATKKVPAKKSVAKKVASTKVSPKKAPASKKLETTVKPLLTVISVNVDVGFGNMLTIRGEGPGLSWDTGVVLDCVADDCWSITLPETTKPVIYKVLVNDISWSAGPDYVAEPGSNNIIKPTF